jgi:myo-inositol-1(or 4)-monophosphatase
LIDLEALRVHAVDIARSAGAALLELYNQPHQTSFKHSRFDIVTEGDKAAEAIIIAALRAAYPQHRIISEEGGGDADSADADYCWFIDPVDGTTNFANNLPHFAVSIALTDSQFRPIIGVVNAPVLGEIYSAAVGLGSDVNGRPLRVSQTDQLEDAVLCSGFASSRKTDEEDNLRQWAHLQMTCRGLRQFGAAALDMCYVAAGKIDGFWELKLKPWDFMAGMLIITEAGGVVSDLKGQFDGMLRGRVLASNGRLHHLLQAHLR